MYWPWVLGTVARLRSTVVLLRRERLLTMDPASSVRVMGRVTCQTKFTGYRCD